MDWVLQDDAYEEKREEGYKASTWIESRFQMSYFKRDCIESSVNFSVPNASRMKLTQMIYTMEKISRASQRRHPQKFYFESMVILENRVHFWLSCRGPVFG